jgi:hypothetical protein
MRRLFACRLAHHASHFYHAPSLNASLPTPPALHTRTHTRTYECTQSTCASATTLDRVSFWMLDDDYRRTMYLGAYLLTKEGATGYKRTNLTGECVRASHTYMVSFNRTCYQHRNEIRWERIAHVRSILA